jgi:acyl-CoA thioester hydrolase
MMDEFPVVVRVPVQWADMDAYGHVNNTVFLRFFETARIAYLERCGLVESMTEHGIGAILHSTYCRFRKPIVFPDEVLVGARVIDTRPDRFTHQYRVYSTSQDAVAAEGEGIIVSYNYHDNVKVELPERVRTAIKAIESRSATGD